MEGIRMLAPGDDLVAQLTGRARFCRDRGEVKSPGLMDEAAARLSALTAQNLTWQRNSRETFDAMCAMRNSINEYLPMPSLESDLLQGPENSVFCAAVAEAVVSEVSRLRDRLARMEGALRQAREDILSLDQITEIGGDITYIDAALNDWPKEEIAPGVFVDVDPETLKRAAPADGGTDE